MCKNMSWYRIAVLAFAPFQVQLIVSEGLPSLSAEGGVGVCFHAGMLTPIREGGLQRFVSMAFKWIAMNLDELE